MAVPIPRREGTPEGKQRVPSGFARETQRTKPLPYAATAIYIFRRGDPQRSPGGGIIWGTVN
jgi:hypothetical protein